MLVQELMFFNVISRPHPNFQFNKWSNFWETNCSIKTNIAYKQQISTNVALWRKKLSSHSSRLNIFDFMILQIDTWRTEVIYGQTSFFAGIKRPIIISGYIWDFTDARPIFKCLTGKIVYLRQFKVQVTSFRQLLVIKHWFVLPMEFLINPLTQSIEAY